MKGKNKQTKFPVARIKKIMQKDDEVGKVAQATPIVISKALELFLGLIVEEAHKVTAARGSKKVEAYHLKHAVETTEMLDFLKEIVEAVPDPSAGGTIDLEAEAAEKKRRGKARRERKEATAADGDAPPKRRRTTKKNLKSEEEVKSEVEEEMDQDQGTPAPTSAHQQQDDDYDESS
ncbi:histone-fold-containing protein [Hymenopellis radicata]|nr:histone-fold-containing protein [Hymenopellis radicata]